MENFIFCAVLKALNEDYISLDKNNLEFTFKRQIFTYTHFPLNGNAIKNIPETIFCNYFPAIYMQIRGLLNQIFI